MDYILLGSLIVHSTEGLNNVMVHVHVFFNAVTFALNHTNTCFNVFHVFRANVTMSNHV